MGLLTALDEGYYPQAPLLLPSSDAFSLQAARVLAWAAQLAYEVDEEDKLARILGRWGWMAPRIIRGRFESVLPLVSTKGYAATAPGGETVIAFAGTEPTSLPNWITDFYIHHSAKGLHSGFMRGAEVVRAEVEEVARQARGGIYLAGHSLGGAIAAINAHLLLDGGALAPGRLRGVYTIGMPRPGNAAYAEEYDASGHGTLGDRTYRLTYGYDIVPQVPPADQWFGFRHVGCVLHCAHGDRFTGTPQRQGGNPSASEAAALALVRALTAGPGTADGAELPPYPAANRFAPRLVDSLPPALRDHLPDRYLHALRE